MRLIRDARYLYEAQPNAREINLEYLEAEAGSGEHWYYVRVEQSDGELAWSSPIWAALWR